MRIISCIASATEIVHALELDPFLVGRSHECDWPPKVSSLPICTRPRFDIEGNSLQIDQRVRDSLQTAGSVYEVLTELIDSLRPTHILTQTQCKVCAVSLDDVESALRLSFQSQPQVIALEPNSLSDIWRDIQRVAESCDRQQTGETLIHRLQERIHVIHSKAATSASKPRVACIEWPMPIMAAGNWIPELVHLANANNLFGSAGTYSPTITFEDLRRANPEVILFLCCGYGLKKSREETRWLTENPAWSNLQAVQNDQVYITDANLYMTRPGPRVVESLEAIAQILHPEIFAPTLENIAWQKL